MKPIPAGASGVAAPLSELPRTASSSDSASRRWWESGWLLVALTAAAYCFTLRCGFIWDDDHYLGKHIVLFIPGGFRRIWAGDTVQYYPLVFSSFWLELRLWGLNAAGFHATNVALHALSAVLAWRALRRLSVPGAWLAAAVFALHPVHVESVAWITERKNVLSGFFYLAALNCYLRHEDESRPRWYVAAFGLYVLALFSKTVTATLPVALLLLRWYRGLAIRKNDVLKLAPMVVLGAALGRVTTWYETHHVGAMGADWNLSPAQRVLIAGRALWFYVGKLCWPTGLSFIYPRWRVAADDPIQWLWPIAAAALALSAWLLRRRVGRAPAAALAIYGVTLLPALGFFNVFPMRYSFVADHFQYLASLAVIALVVGSFGAALRGRTEMSRTAIVPAGALLVVLAGLAWKQTQAYESKETLWKDVIAKNPSCSMAHDNLGTEYYLVGRYEAALSEYELALRYAPGDPGAIYNIGNVYFKQGRYGPAEARFREALRNNPEFSVANTNLCNLLFRTGRAREAADYGRRAVAHSPDMPEACFALGAALAAISDADGAIEHYRHGLLIQPTSAAVRLELAQLLASRSQYGEAIATLEYPLADAEGWAECLNALARLLATCPDERLRDTKRAVYLAEQAEQLAGGRNPRFLDTLAVAYEAAGQRSGAVDAARRGLRLAEATGAAELAVQLQRRLSAWEEAGRTHQTTTRLSH